MDRIAIVGGGPGGLFLATLLKRAVPALDVTVFERNDRASTFGFGVVFSDATLRNIDEVDPILRTSLRDFGTHWERIVVRSKGETHGFGGNGMAAIHRRVLLQHLQRNAEEAGAELLFNTVAPPLDELRRGYDLVVGADGTNSSIRAQLEARAPLGHHVDEAAAKFIWFGTTHLFDGLTFLHRVSEHGNLAVHGYPISDELSTFIVETDADTWKRAGMDRFDVDQPPGASDTESRAYLEELFAPDIAGAPLVANNSRWASFRTRRTDHWWRDDVVLLGDAVHTAHFSVGSGTKMAMEDAIELAARVAGVARGESRLPEALAAYQDACRASTGRIQAAAGPSLSWWEHFGRYQQAFDPLTFAFHFFSRSIGIDRIAGRDPGLAEDVRRQWRDEHGRDALATPIAIHGHHFAGRRLGLERDGGTARLSDTSAACSVRVVEVADDAEPTELAALLPDTGAVLIAGQPSLNRLLLAEQARLWRGLVTIVAGPDLDDPTTAETLILSGRADAVAVPQA